MSELFPAILNVIGAEARALAGPLRAVAACHGAADEISWLSDGYAFDIGFGGDAAAVLTEARALAAGLGADINVLPADGRRKALLIADMDSTIITCECLDELAAMAGLKDKIAAITERAMRGEIAFEPALRERVGMLRGLKLDALEAVMQERVRLTAGAKALLATMRAHGAHTMLVSGGFSFFTARVAAAAGFHAHRGNTLLDDGARLTGAVGEPVLGRDAKRQALLDEARARGLALAQTLAAGDGANDLAMIAEAGLGVAFHAKPVVAEAAGARLDHADLTGLLYLQGYSDAEIARP